jgi:hypothetical protein
VVGVGVGEVGLGLGMGEGAAAFCARRLANIFSFLAATSGST